MLKLFLSCAMILLPAASSLAGEGERKPPYTLADAQRLSSFGERPAFSPDGKRVAFVGRTFGDAFEIDLATGKLRNLTAEIPHQGILRIQYLANGDYLVTAPRIYRDRSSRFESELWVLDKSLKKGLQPLDQPVFEGVAVSRISAKIAWLEMGPDFEKPRIENGQYIVPNSEKGTLIIKTGDIVYRDGVPGLTNRREVLRRSLPACGAEPQDFRRRDSELTMSCATAPKDDGVFASSLGLNLKSGRLIVYRSEEREYNEIEGMAPDESWALVECGPRTRSGIGPLDLCRLELAPHGAMTPLVVTPRPSTRKTTNGVVSPDGRWIAFQAADSGAEYGVGDGIYLLRLGARP